MFIFAQMCVFLPKLYIKGQIRSIDHKTISMSTTTDHHVMKAVKLGHWTSLYSIGQFWSYRVGELGVNMRHLWSLKDCGVLCPYLIKPSHNTFQSTDFGCKQRKHIVLHDTRFN